jgi:multidrug efflux pump subunit AcrB
MFKAILSRGIIVAVATLILTLIGVVGALRIPVQMIPDLDVRVISIRTVWPGATPQDVEKEILIEQERYLRNLPSLIRMQSSARSGQAEIELEFPFGTDMTEMQIRVNNALSQVQGYPENVDEPRIYANSFSSNAFMFFSITPLPGNPRQINMDLALDFVEDTIQPRLARVTGVSEISIWGGTQRQIQIRVDPFALAQRNLTLSEVREAIRLRNRDRSGGEIEAGKRQYLLRTIGRFEDLQALENLILTRRNDSIVRLKDVASVSLGTFEQRALSSFNGSENLFVAVRREPGSNVIDIKQAMLAEVAAVKSQLLEPQGLTIFAVSDDVKYVEDSIANIWQNLVLGALLATTILYFFLRSGRATLMAVLGIPLCVVVAFLGLLLAGRTVNVISLAGIAFAIGMTLDNSIVVLESIENELRKGKTRCDASLAGITQVWPAVLASTLTTILVFLPVLFVEQEAGQLYSDIAVAISAAILASMLVAITLIPTILARLGIDAKPIPVIEQATDALTLKVKSIISTQRARIITVTLSILTSVSVLWWLTPPAEYLPEGEEPKVFAVMNAPPGYNLQTMAAIAQQVEDYLLPQVGVNRNAYDNGQTSVPPMAYMNMRIGPESLRIIAEPTSPRDIEPLMDAITAHYETYPGMRGFASRGSIISSNDGGSRSINVDISGADLNEIYGVARSIYDRAYQVLGKPRIQSRPSSLTLSQPMAEVHPHWERAAELGLNAQSIGFTIAALTDGSYVDEFFIDDDKIDIYLFSNAGQNPTLESLAHLPIYTPAGAIVPVSDIAEIVDAVDTAQIRRINGGRTVTLNIIPPRSTALETGVEIVQHDVVDALKQEGAIPSHVQIDISGAADQLDATKASLLENYSVALLIIYLLMVAIFSHWGYPLIIMTSIPVGVAGGIVGLALLNGMGALLPALGLAPLSQPFDMISMLGFLILMGTVVNNPILIVDQAVKNHHNGSLPVDAVLNAVKLRLRPIMMSTLTTVFGLAPLVFIPGAGTELYRGVGVIVMFGILGATLVTLTLLPAITVWLLQWTSKKAS